MKLGDVFDKQNLMHLYFAVGKSAEHIVTLVNVKTLVKYAAA